MEFFTDPGSGWVEVGRSALNRPIYKKEFGWGDDVTLIFGGFHGDERATPFLVLRLAELLESERDLPLPGRRVVVVPYLNPDGYLRNTRRNARDVDLNRNYPTRNWGEQPDGEDRVYFGVRPASEPETRSVLRLLESLRPRKIISIHQPLGCNNNDGPAGLELARLLSEWNGYPVKPHIGFSTPGSFGTYAGKELGIPMVTLELPAGEPGSEEFERMWEKNRGALLAVIHHVQTEGSARPREVE